MDTTTSKTLDIGTQSVRDIRKVVAALGAKITDEHPTPGACGYTTLTITPADPRTHR